MQSSIEKVEFVHRDTCPFHDDSQGEYAERLRDYSSIEDKLCGRTFKILRCATCGVGLTDPYPSVSTLKWLYLGRESVANFDPIRGTFIDWLKGIFARRDIHYAHTIGGSPEIESVLDFGAGNGRFSLASRKVFPKCRVDAVDFDDEPPIHLNNVQGIRYIQLDSFLKESQQYDLILLRGVLEHVHDPVNMLRTLAQRLSARGILYMEVPNIDSAYIHYFGKDCNSYGVPYHLFNFDLASLQSIIASAGLMCKIFGKGLPVAGCVLAMKMDQERNLAHQILGIALHPIQLYLERKKGKYLLAAVCKKK